MAIAVAVGWTSPASAAVPATLHDPVNCATATAGPLDYELCDDGLPNAGGLVPNTTGGAAITVPARYDDGGEDYAGLPLKAADANTTPGANPADGTIGLDVNVSLPRSAPPSGGYPLLFMMHGCCSGNKTSWQASSFDTAGEKWHYSNAWFASRGYVVVNYTARGFVNNNNRGSTGQTQLDSRQYEINDYQHLACQIADSASLWNDVTGQSVAINNDKVVVTGGSYGGGFSWMAATDPEWTCDPVETGSNSPMSLAVAAPRYGWTDLAYTLVPNGRHSQSPDDPPLTNGCDTGPRTVTGALCPGGGAPVGTAKQSIVAALYASGNAAAIDHTTFPQSIHEGFQCLEGPFPYETNPSCTNVLASTLPEFLRERSAYYQNEFFDDLDDNNIDPVPIFNAATFTDQLFPAVENRRMINRLLAEEPGYPIQAYYGDYQHFVQNKAKEWGDLCGVDRHVCGIADYVGGATFPQAFNSDPPLLIRQGVTTRLNRFVDHYAEPDINPSEPTPDFDVTASLQVCPENAGDLGLPADEPGPRFTESIFEDIAPNTLSVAATGEQQTTSKVPGNTHAANADPVGNSVSNGGACPVEGSVAGPGVASYSSDPLPSDATMVGATEVTVPFELSGPAQGLQLNARLYDVYPDGQAVLVDRGTRVLSAAEAAAGETDLGLHGNGWRFEGGHQVRIELAQDDAPFVHASDPPSSLTLTAANLAVPIREGNISVGGGADSRPACGNRIDGTRGRDRLRGSEYGDEIRGKRAKDRLKGVGADDCLRGGAGADRANGGPGKDLLKGGRGNDRLRARDGERDRVRCGKGGRDRAKVDGKDQVRSCERIRS